MSKYIEETVGRMSPEEVTDCLQTIMKKINTQTKRDAEMYGSIFITSLRILGYNTYAEEVESIVQAIS